MAGAGDVNGDGFADVIVGIRHDQGAYYPSGGYSYSGASFVIFGSASAAISGFTLWGVVNHEAIGLSVGGAADVNGDGFADVVVGGYASRSYIIFGKASGLGPISLSSLNGTNGFRLDGAAGGAPIASAGDVNGDGFTDVIVGAALADPHGPDSGSSYVVFGRALLAAVIRAGAAASQYISGGPFADTLIGHGGNDTFEGRRGADHLWGKATSNDTASYLQRPRE